jgi:hypothetical protein
LGRSGRKFDETLVSSPIFGFIKPANDTKVLWRPKPEARICEI